MAGYLPQFLPTLGGGAPTVRVFFDIFIRKHCLKGSSPMIEIQDILDEEPIDGQGSDEDLIDPLADALADRRTLS
ncbi:hypothetical protein KDH_27970 [Dictyobacter sp. S3.2.2.5]|uniref:Uncharacterized protein n=1 Tax=Dictyobacter halimunensis TaxID=3026934 RepID=A0ABQ6FTV6_9CHLR|nr:hypothetical protein KDH_27970 [Dictyobacter sp. S3.2.2.5]